MTNKQFNILYNFAADFEEEPDEIVDIKWGLECTLFLSKSGKAWIIGCISQIGEFVFESDDLVLLNDQWGSGGKLDMVPSFAKDFMESRLKEKGEFEDESNFKFTKIDIGYSHAMLLDSEGRVHVFGAGHYGQLGLGFDIIKAKKPIIVEEINDGYDRIISIACGSNSWVAYSELGLLYVWGMLNAEDLNSISYFPTLIGVPDEVILTHINSQPREILAWDVHGNLYRCDFEFRRRLKRIEKEKYVDSNNLQFFIRKVFCGRSMRILLDSLLSPEKSWIVDKVEIMETLIENEITIELYDILNETYCIKDEKSEKDNIFEKIKILFMTSKSVNLSLFKIWDYRSMKKVEPKVWKKREDIKEDSEEEEIITTKGAHKTTSEFNKKKVKPVGTKPKPKGKAKKEGGSKGSTSTRPSTVSEPVRLEIVDPEDVEPEEEKKSEIAEVEKEELTFNVGDYNCVKFKVYFELDEEIPSKIRCKILPQNGEDYDKVFCRVFLGNTELKESNFEMEIIKSQLHKDLDAENEMRKAREALIREQRRLAKIKAREERERKKKEKEEERLRQQKLKEEAARKRKEETMKRAQEAVRKAKEMREQELRLIEEERKMRKEMRCGGGFNMTKLQIKLKEAELLEEKGNFDKEETKEEQ